MNLQPHECQHSTPQQPSISNIFILLGTLRSGSVCMSSKCFLVSALVDECEKPGHFKFFLFLLSNRWHSTLPQHLSCCFNQ